MKMKEVWVVNFEGDFRDCDAVFSTKQLAKDYLKGEMERGIGRDLSLLHEGENFATYFFFRDGEVKGEVIAEKVYITCQEIDYYNPHNRTDII